MAVHLPQYISDTVTAQALVKSCRSQKIDVRSDYFVEDSS